ncbi:hypothetical protein L1887_02826 [Cichorium endivia]|nr:hypothetical protein L1887_02826 [Cichorium endivia]
MAPLFSLSPTFDMEKASIAKDLPLRIEQSSQFFTFIVPEVSEGKEYKPFGSRKNIVLQQCFHTTWKYLTVVISKCLTHKIGSQDQLSLRDIPFLYAMVENVRLNFATMIFEVLAAQSHTEPSQVGPSEAGPNTEVEKTFTDPSHHGSNLHDEESGEED